MLSVAVRFVQLSDIHFVRDAGNPRELDGELRNGCLNQIVRLNREKAIDAILVCGDIAFSGQVSEYQRAATFLRDLTSRIGLRSEHVFVVPGNHDIDRGVTETQSQIDLRTTLRQGTDDEREAALGRALRDGDVAQQLFEPLRNYVSFAHAYDCPTTAESPYWDFSVFDGDKEVCFRGMNTALVSHEADDEQQQRLVVGRFQVPTQPSDSSLNVTMAHHPKEWVHDAKRIWQRLENRVGLLITGHTHQYEVRSTPAGAWLRAGALQPSRKDDGWVPHFSVVDIDKVDNGFEVRVAPWAWEDNDGLFFAQKEETHPVPPPAGVGEDSVTDVRRADLKLEANLRGLRIRLGALAPAEILVATSAALGKPFEKPLTEAQATLARAAVEAAASSGRLAALWNEIDGLRTQPEANPFT